MDEIKAISVRSVSFSYGSEKVLSDVSFDLGRGETMGVVGPNGSGKTTLIGLVTGLLRPSEGEVMVMGRPLKSYSRRELARRVAVVPQANEMVFPYRVEETVAMGRYPFLGWGGWATSGDRQICDRAMDLAGILTLRRRVLGHLSSGERQRVFLARALAQEPAILLLDEASSFLDIGQEMAVFSVLNELQKQKELTLLAVSHDLNLVGRFSRRILMLRSGRVLSQGRLEEHYTSGNLTDLFGIPVESKRRAEGGMRVSW